MIFINIAILYPNLGPKNLFIATELSSILGLEL